MKRNWEYKKLGDVASFRRGLTYAKDDVVNHSSKIVLRSNNINLETSSLNFDDVVCLRDDFVIPLDKLLRGGDIFICMSNGSTQHLGKVAHVQENLNMAFGGFMGVIEPNENLTNSRYVFYCCRSGAYRSYLNSIFNGANINNLKWSDLSKFVIPVPPLDEQSRIVAELDLLTGIIDKQNAQLKELDNLAQAIFYDMFGDPIENPKGWDVKKLGDVCVKLTDGTHNSPVNTPSGDYPYITAKNIRKNGIDLSDLTYVSKEVHQEIYSRCNPEYGDVLYIKDGITTGIAQVNVLDFEFSLLSSVALLKLDKKEVNPYFITGFLNNDSVYKAARSNMGGAAITRLTLTKLKSFRVVVPPLKLQQEFADKITAIESQKSAINQSMAETQKLLDYTMDKYFG